jgi:hypothetical protein
MVELNIFGRRMNIVGVYAPTNSCPEKTKDKLWETLNGVLDKISNTIETFLTGDFNARLGKKDSQMVGRFEEEEMRNNGERLKEVHDYHNLKISNTFLNTAMYINIHG